MKPVNSLEYDSRRAVSGKSVVNHQIRIILKLSAEEYIFLDFIYNHNITSKENITFRDYYRETGYAPKDVNAFIQHMKQRGLLVWNDREKRVDVYDDWKAFFKTDLRAEFNQLWKILKKGSSVKAKERLPRCLKKIPFEDLKAKLEAYVAHCDKYNIIKKGLDVFLNDKMEHWNDPLVGHERKSSFNKPIQEQQTSTSIKFKKV